MLKLGTCALLLTGGLAAAQSNDLECVGRAPETRSAQSNAKSIGVQRNPPVLRKEGYFDVVVPVEFVGVVTQLRQSVPADSQGIRRGDWTRVASVAESPNRQSSVWLASSGTQAMVTTWDFLADGAVICRPSSSLNAKLGSDGASLSLMRSQLRTDLVVWKLTWIRGNSRQYELYVEDRLENGSPTLNTGQVIAIGNSLASAN